MPIPTCTRGQLLRTLLSNSQTIRGYLSIRRPLTPQGPRGSYYVSKVDYSLAYMHYMTPEKARNNIAPSSVQSSLVITRALQRRASGCRQQGYIRNSCLGHPGGRCHSTDPRPPGSPRLRSYMFVCTH